MSCTPVMKKTTNFKLGSSVQRWNDTAWYKARAKWGWELIRVDEISNSRSRLAWNSHALSATLMHSQQLSCALGDSHALSSNLNLLKFFLRVVESFFSFGQRSVMIVAESWRKLSSQLSVTLVLVWPGIKRAISRYFTSFLRSTKLPSNLGKPQNIVY